jgi:hypothetical protein
MLFRIIGSHPLLARSNSALDQPQMNSSALMAVTAWTSDLRPSLIQSGSWDLVRGSSETVIQTSE